MTQLLTQNKTDTVLKTYYIKYLVKKDEKEAIKEKLERISLQYSQTWKPLEEISEIDQLLYLR